MTSINYNSSASSALQTLSTINKNLESTQSRVSSGYKVQNASDNVAYWSISTTMKSDNKALGAATDALNVGAAKVDVAYDAMDSAIDVVNEIKAKLVTANESSTDKDQIALEVGKLKDQLSSIAQSASFSGENWVVAGTSSTSSVVDGFVRNNDGTVQVTTATYSTGSYAMFSAMSSVGTGSGGILGSLMEINLSSTSTTGDLSDFMDTVETALSNLTTGAAALGALTTRIDMQSTFGSKLSDAIDSGVSGLVDADMEAESAKLSALQTQQQLAIQSLSIANSSSSSILSLFR